MSTSDEGAFGRHARDDVPESGREGEYQDRDVASDASGKSRVADTPDSEALDADVIDDGEFTDRDVVEEVRPQPVEGSFVDRDVATDVSQAADDDIEGSYVDRDLGDAGADGGADSGADGGADGGAHRA